MVIKTINYFRIIVDVDVVMLHLFLNKITLTLYFLCVIIILFCLTKYILNPYLINLT